MPLLRLRHRILDLRHRAAVMAIVNRTPDSFFDRGRTFELDRALDHALAAVEQGADLIDVGGVKAGPGETVGVRAEIERIVPFVAALRGRSDVPISVDTYRAEVARQALAAGADVVNDVSGLTEPEIAEAVAAVPGAALVVMHAGGPPRTRPFRPSYLPDVTTVVVRTLVRLTEEAQRRGVAPEQLIVDPGHDFGKNTLHSLELCRRTRTLAELGHPVLVALSRKDFLGEVLGGLPPDERLEASLAAAVLAVEHGASLVRVHDPRATVRALRTAEAILGRRLPERAARGLE